MKTYETLEMACSKYIVTKAVFTKILKNKDKKKLRKETNNELNFFFRYDPFRIQYTSSTSETLLKMYRHVTFNIYHVDKLPNFKTDLQIKKLEKSCSELGVMNMVSSTLQQSFPQNL